MATLLQLRQRVLVQLNDAQATGFTVGNGDRYKIPQINQTINDVQQFYVKMIAQFYQGYFRSPAPISVNALAGVDRYALGPTFRSPILEARRTINNTNYTLDPLQPYMFNRSITLVDNSVWLPNYWLEGNTIAFSSAPINNETAAVIVSFQGKIADLLLDASTTDDQLYDAEGCIVLRSSIRLLKAKDVSGALKTIGGWEKELQDEERIMMSQIGKRFIKHDKPIPNVYPDDIYF